MELEQIKKRFLKEGPSMQLGHLASDLVRISGFIQRGMISEAMPVIYESKFFAEWAAPTAAPRVQSLLAEIQCFLALKESCLGQADQLEEISSNSQIWSRQLLREAGLG